MQMTKIYFVNIITGFLNVSLKSVQRATTAEVLVLLGKKNVISRDFGSVIMAERVDKI